MTPAFKERLKAVLADAGMLPAAVKLQSRLNRNEARNFRTAFRFYVYNHWLTNFPSATVRLAYLRHVLGLEIGKETFIHMGCFFEGDQIAIGDNTVIGRDCFLGGDGGTLRIKNNVSITARSYMFCASHDVDSPDFASVHKDVTIEDRAWVGAGAMIMPGVTVGEGAVLAAASVATKDVPEFTVAGGVPAKPIGIRNRALRYTLKYWAYFN